MHRRALSRRKFVRAAAGAVVGDSSAKGVLDLLILLSDKLESGSKLFRHFMDNGVHVQVAKREGLTRCTWYRTRLEGHLGFGRIGKVAETQGGTRYWLYRRYRIP